MAPKNTLKVTTHSEEAHKKAQQDNEKPSTRAKRPSQQPPVAFRRSRTIDELDLDSSSDSDTANEADNEAPQGTAGVPKRTYLPHKEREARKNRKWNERRPLHTQMQQQYQQYEQQDVADLQQWLVEQMGKRIHRSIANHHCSVHLGAPLPEQLGATRPVECHAFGTSVQIGVPTVSCSTCNKTWEVSAFECGCCPSSPDLPSLWYSDNLMQHYTYLAFTEGVSSTEYANGMMHVHQRGSMRGSPGKVDDRPFREAWREHRRSARFMREPASLGVTALKQLAPFSDCPACAGVPVPDGGQVGSSSGAQACPDYIPIWSASSQRFGVKAICLDANVKLCRYRAAGLISDGDIPVFSTYFGSADGSIQAMVQSKTLPNAVFTDSGADGCHPSLSCARATAKSGGVCDIFGVAGCVCCHGFPAEGGFVNMPTPEQFVYYDEILAALLPSRHVQDVYIDIACRYRPHWLRVGPEELTSSPPAFMVPWMHARSHGRDCFLSNSGMHHDGACRRVGEQTEQHWAVSKRYAHLTKYMKPHNRQDFIDDAQGFHSSRKAKRFPELMVELTTGALAKQVECKKRIALVESDGAAATPPISQAQLATAAAAAGMRPPSRGAQAPKDQLLAQYVRHHMERDALRQVRTHAEAFAVTLTTAEGRALHAKGQDEDRLEKIDAALVKLDMQLKNRQPLRPADADYQRGKQLLKEQEVQRLRSAIEDEVAALAALRLERTREGSANKNTRSIINRAKARRKRIRDLVASLSSWDSSEVWNEDRVKQLFEAKFPWREDGVSSAELPYLAGKYKDCLAERERTEEELVLLRWERQRSLAYYNYKVTTMQQAILSKTTHLAKVKAALDKTASAETVSTSHVNNDVSIAKALQQLHAEIHLLRCSVEDGIALRDRAQHLWEDL